MAPLDTAGDIYVIWAMGTACYKIGFSRNLTKRFRSLRTMSPLPLQIIARKPGKQYDEMKYHAMLHRYRDHGEWFRLEEKDLVLCLLEAFGQAMPAETRDRIIRETEEKCGCSFATWNPTQTHSPSHARPQLNG